MNRIKHISILLLTVFSLFSCKKEDTVLPYTVTEEPLGCCKLKIIATINRPELLTEPFFSVTVSTPSYSSLPAMKYNTNKVQDGKMWVVVSTSPVCEYSYSTRLIQNGVNYDQEERTYKTGDLPSGLIDMGLSVKWASNNLGALGLEDLGDHFAWGEATSKESFTWSNYKWCHGSEESISKYNEYDGIKVLEPEDDAATYLLGAQWHTPTINEYQELLDNCEWTWISYKGASGLAATSPVTLNTIFFPSSMASGHWSEFYWSSSLFADSTYAMALRSQNQFAVYDPGDDSIGLRLIPINGGTDNIARSSAGLIRPVSK